jgi:hypothetical protein
MLEPLLLLSLPLLPRCRCRCWVVGVRCALTVILWQRKLNKLVTLRY